MGQIINTSYDADINDVLEKMDDTNQADVLPVIPNDHFNIIDIFRPRMAEDIWNLADEEVLHTQQVVRFEEEAYELNDAQSTHNAAAHASASESAIKLLDAYSSQINGKLFKKTWDRLYQDVMLQPSSWSGDAAKRCVVRLSGIDTYVDSVSNVSFKQLLVLAWQAIYDSTRRLGNKDDAVKLLIEGLYEIQRGGNLGQYGEDDLEADEPICASGAFNKIIEKLNGICSIVELRFVSPETASLKIQKIVQEEAKTHLNTKASPMTAVSFLQFIHLISEIGVKGLECIYAKLKGSIATRFFAEFGSLYTSRDDQQFVAIVDSGEYARLPELDIFKEKLLHSEGYREYCSKILTKL